MIRLKKRPFAGPLIAASLVAVMVFIASLLPGSSDAQSTHMISGIISAIDTSILTLKTRDGKSVKIDDSQAAKNERIGLPLKVGIPVTAQGSVIEGSGALEAVSIVRAKGTSGELWPPDR